MPIPLHVTRTLLALWAIVALGGFLEIACCKRDRNIRTWALIVSLVIMVACIIKY